MSVVVLQYKRLVMQRLINRKGGKTEGFNHTRQKLVEKTVNAYR